MESFGAGDSTTGVLLSVIVVVSIVSASSWVLINSKAAIEMSAMMKCEFSLSSWLHSRLICWEWMKSKTLVFW